MKPTRVFATHQNLFAKRPVLGAFAGDIVLLAGGLRTTQNSRHPNVCMSEVQGKTPERERAGLWEQSAEKRQVTMQPFFQ